MLLLAAVLSATSHAGRVSLATMAPVVLSADSPKRGSLAISPPLRIVFNSLHLRGGVNGPNTMDMLTKMVELAPNLPEEKPGPHAKDDRPPPNSGERGSHAFTIRISWVLMSCVLTCERGGVRVI